MSIALRDLVPQDLRAAACQGVLFDDIALQLGYLFCRVITGDVGPARVFIPIFLDFCGGTRLTR